MQCERSRECQVAREMQGILAGMSSAAAVAEKGAEMRHMVGGETGGLEDGRGGVLTLG